MYCVNYDVNSHKRKFECKKPVCEMYLNYETEIGTKNTLLYKECCNEIFHLL